jgi:hypothetical protein
MPNERSFSPEDLAKMQAMRAAFADEHAAAQRVQLPWDAAPGAFWWGQRDPYVQHQEEMEYQRQAMIVAALGRADFLRSLGIKP